MVKYAFIFSKQRCWHKELCSECLKVEKRRGDKKSNWEASNRSKVNKKAGNAVIDVLKPPAKQTFVELQRYRSRVRGSLMGTGNRIAADK